MTGPTKSTGDIVLKYFKNCNILDYGILDSNILDCNILDCQRTNRPSPADCHVGYLHKTSCMLKTCVSKGDVKDDQMGHGIGVKEETTNKFVAVIDEFANNKDLEIYMKELRSDQNQSQ